MNQTPHLSDLQLAIMRSLWERTEATVAQVHGDLHAERGLAPTTVATLLSRMEKRGLVTHRTEGRQFVYRALVNEQEVRRSMVSELTDLLFEGDPAELVNHLLSARDFGSDDLARVKALLAEKERNAGGNGDDSI
jgi:BlaI family penicillinase repressor